MSRPLTARAIPRGAVSYVNVSHKGLTRLDELRLALGDRQVTLTVMIHDLMPITQPRWFPSQLRLEFEEGIESVRAQADLVVANSVATAESLQRHWHLRDAPELLTAHLGVCLPAVPVPTRVNPYFVFLGSLEERKNVEVLLDVWDRLAMERGAPTLLLLSPRPADGGLRARLASSRAPIRLLSGLHDRAVAQLLCGARALLMPSRAEGFGLPVVEALSLGVPVICSDLPALREVANDVPCLVDPDDREAWLGAVRTYVEDDSLDRRAQLERASRLRLATWSEHFALVEAALGTTEPQSMMTAPTA